MKTRRATIGLAVAAFCLATPSSAQEFAPHVDLTPERVVNLLAWSDYFDASVLAEFSKETGVKIVYDTYQSSAALDAALASANVYDIVVISGPQLQKAIAGGSLQKLDQGKLPNAKGLWPEIMARLAAYDPANQYAVNYMWFTTGLAFNVALAKARLGQAVPSSWDLLFRPDLLKKFSDCGVQIIDSPVDLFTNALAALKLAPQSRNPADLKRAAELIRRMKPFVRRFNSGDYAEALARGDICLAIGWTGDAVLARSRAQEANNGIDIAYVIPNEGTLVSLDNLAIARNAPHVADAHRFIDFLMKPEIAARNSRATGLANGVIASRPLVDAELADDPAIYPPNEVIKRLFTAPIYDRVAQDVLTREWAQIKSGK